ncbi:MAG: hypothetical protein Kow00127_14380 [Bacteroidales bacterium]
MVKLRITIAFLLASLTITGQTWISSGEVTGSWTPEGNPYLVEGDLFVAPEERLSIEPGVEVVFTGPYVLEVYGRLEAIGTASDSIFFRAADTTAFGQPQYDGWQGIVFVGYNSITNEPSLLSYCNISYSAGNGVTTVFYSSLNISHSRIERNMGRGLMMLDFSDITVEESVITGNLSGGAGAEYSSPLFSNTAISSNTGTGLSLTGMSSSGAALFENGTISFNQSNELGGAIHLSEEASLEITGSTIINNEATDGAAVSLSGSWLDASNTVFSQNYSSEGSTIAAENSGLNLESCLIADNSGQAGASAMLLYETPATLVKNTIANNYSESGDLPVIATTGTSTLTINSSIIWGNNGGIEYDLLTPEITWSDIEYGFEGIGNINSDPLFADATNGDYTLSWIGYPFENQETSPCIDAGDPALTPDPDGTITDMGAYSFAQGLATGINRHKTAGTLSVYPNPAPLGSTVRFSDPVSEYVITTLNGQVVESGTSARQSVRVDEAGFYLINVTTADGQAKTVKLIVR